MGRLDSQTPHSFSSDTTASDVADSKHRIYQALVTVHRIDASIIKAFVITAIPVVMIAIVWIVELGIHESLVGVATVTTLS